jgi:hypothetical protein
VANIVFTIGHSTRSLEDFVDAGRNDCPEPLDVVVNRP